MKRPLRTCALPSHTMMSLARWLAVTFCRDTRGSAASAGAAHGYPRAPEVAGSPRQAVGPAWQPRSRQRQTFPAASPRGLGLAWPPKLDPEAALAKGRVPGSCSPETSSWPRGTYPDLHLGALTLPLLPGDGGAVDRALLALRRLRALLLHHLPGGTAQLSLRRVSRAARPAAPAVPGAG